MKEYQKLTKALTRQKSNRQKYKTYEVFNTLEIDFASSKYRKLAKTLNDRLLSHERLFTYGFTLNPSYTLKCGLLIFGKDNRTTRTTVNRKLSSHVTSGEQSVTSDQYPSYFRGITGRSTSTVDQMLSANERLFNYGFTHNLSYTL